MGGIAKLFGGGNMPTIEKVDPARLPLRQAAKLRPVATVTRRSVKALHLRRQALLLVASRAAVIL